MTPAISVTGLTRRYRDHTALDDINIAISGGTITGLLGRNGAGKTTLLRILAGQEFPSSGSVRVLGAPPAENEDVLRRLLFVREDQAYPEIKVGQALRAASWFHPNWDSTLASSLLDDFGLRANKGGRPGHHPPRRGLMLGRPGPLAARPAPQTRRHNQPADPER
jgi:ABC-2 type transport system ATP-binding protein